MFGEDAAASQRPRIKVCGITNQADAEAAVQFGADALGFNCFPGSSRYLELATAGDWIGRLPGGLCRIAVMVDPGFEQAMAVARLPFITGLQLHGAETPDFGTKLASLGIRFAKALPVFDETALADIPFYGTEVLVLDSASQSSFGGSGKVFSWAVARDFIKTNPRYRVILAGGLTPENVAEAVRTVRPFGVDVTTGVESSRGRKDHGRLRAFIEAAKQVPLG